MTTKFIGIKEFRQNLSKLSRDAKKKPTCFIVMHHSIPLWKVEPLDDEDDLIDMLILKKYEKEIMQASKEAREGKTLTSEEVRRNLKL